MVVCATRTGNNRSTDKECVLMIVFFNSYRVSHLANSPHTTALSYRISTTAKHLFFIIIFNFFDHFEPTVGSVSSSFRVTSSQTPNKGKIPDSFFTEQRKELANFSRLHCHIYLKVTHTVQWFTIELVRISRQYPPVVVDCGCSLQRRKTKNVWSVVKRQNDTTK